MCCGAMPIPCNGVRPDIMSYRLHFRICRQNHLLWLACVCAVDVLDVSAVWCMCQAWLPEIGESIRVFVGAMAIESNAELHLHIPCGRFIFYLC